jgi:hypothetical protein
MEALDAEVASHSSLAEVTQVDALMHVYAANQSMAL